MLRRDPPISLPELEARAAAPSLDGFACPGCGGALVLRCVVVSPPAPTRILAGLQRARGPPTSAPAGDDRRA